MATIQGPTRYEFWKKEPIDPFYGSSIRINEYMSKNCFEDILSSLHFADKEPMDYIDKLYQIRDLVDAWNDNMHNSWLGKLP
jgi:Transposase IS4